MTISYRDSIVAFALLSKLPMVLVPARGFVTVIRKSPDSGR